jgi:hypothetical protein
MRKSKIGDKMVRSSQLAVHSIITLNSLTIRHLQKSHIFSDQRIE